MLQLILGSLNPIVIRSSQSSQNCSLFPLNQYVIYIIYATRKSMSRSEKNHRHSVLEYCSQRFNSFLIYEGAVTKGPSPQGIRVPFATLDTRRDWNELTFAKTSGTVARDRANNKQIVSPVTIPETMAGFQSPPPRPHSFLKWPIRFLWTND